MVKFRNVIFVFIVCAIMFAVYNVIVSIDLVLNDIRLNLTHQGLTLRFLPSRQVSLTFYFLTKCFTCPEIMDEINVLACVCTHIKVKSPCGCTTSLI